MKASLFAYSNRNSSWIQSISVLLFVKTSVCKYFILKKRNLYPWTYLTLIGQLVTWKWDCQFREKSDIFVLLDFYHEISWPYIRDFAIEIINFQTLSTYIEPLQLLEVLLLVLESVGIQHPSPYHDSARLMVTFMGLRRLRILVLSAVAEALCRDYDKGSHGRLFIDIMGIPEALIGRYFDYETS